ncbi:hypothetical protein GCM10027060_05480 [Nesterenkonia halophila]
MGYGQFSPIAKTMEVLDETWTVLIIREMVAGSHHFNEIRHGLPRMSTALLSKRLRSLERTGIVVRRAEGSRTAYDLTPGGRALEPVIQSLGEWGVQWRSELGDDDLDPHLLLWDIHRNIDVAALPEGRVVLAFTFTDVEPRTRTWWIVVSADGDVDVCDVDPGHPATVRMSSTLRTMVDVWRGQLSWSQALRSERLHLSGAAAARHSLPRWLMLSPFAALVDHRQERASSSPPTPGPDASPR